MRAKPRILFETALLCVSRMQTAEPGESADDLVHAMQREKADVLFVVPLPRRIASRPVSWMAETMELGGAVPSMKTSWSLRLASTFLMPIENRIR